MQCRHPLPAQTDKTRRHLAHKWATTYIQPHTKRRLLPTQTNEIHTLEHLVLLDLLGAPNPLIRPFFTQTAWLFDAMVSAESRLRESDLLLTQEVKVGASTPVHGVL